MKKIIKNRIFIVIITLVIGISGTLYATTKYNASEVLYNPSDGEATNVNDALNELYNMKKELADLYEQTQNKKILELGTSKTHSYDMKSLYPNDYQNFTVDDFIVEVKNGSNSSSYSCSDCYFSTTNHTASSYGTYSLKKTYDSTTGIFTANATISSSGNVTRYNGTFWSHSGTSNLNSTVYFLKNN